jgi:hypothetical protein
MLNTKAREVILEQITCVMEAGTCAVEDIPALAVAGATQGKGAAKGDIDEMLAFAHRNVDVFALTRSAEAM